MLVAFSFPFHTLKGHGGGRRCTFPGCDKGARDKFFCKFDDVLASRGEGFVGLIRIQILSELPEKSTGISYYYSHVRVMDQGVALASCFSFSSGSLRSRFQRKFYMSSP